MEVNKRNPKVKPLPSPKRKDPFELIRDEIKGIRDDLNINHNLPRFKNPPPPPPIVTKEKVSRTGWETPEPPPRPMEVKGLYVYADDYFKSYFKSKYQEDELPIHYSIITLLVVIIILLVYLCIKASI